MQRCPRLGRLGWMPVVLASIASIALVTSAFTGSAFADDKKVKGFEIMIRPGYGSAGSGSPVGLESNVVAPAGSPKLLTGEASPYGGGLVFDGYVGARVAEYISVGLGAGFRNSSASAIPDGDGLKRSAFTVAPYVRAYFPMVPVVDLWVQAGVGYTFDSQKYNGTVPTTAGNLPGTWTLEHRGVALPLGFGVDYPILPMIAMGPSFFYTPVFSAGGCFIPSVNGVEAKQCTDANPKIAKTSNYGVWSIGLDLRLTL